MRKRSKILGNQSKMRFLKFLKKVKTDQKLRFLKFLKKAETDQKYAETDQKFEETDQQNEIFKLFLKKRKSNF